MGIVPRPAPTPSAGLRAVPANAAHRDRAVAFVIDKYAPFIGGAERQAQLLAGLLSSRLARCDVFTAQ